MTIKWENMNDDTNTKHQFAKCSDCPDQDLLPYDFDSLMHYTSFAFSNNGRKTIVVKDDPERVVAENAEEHTFSPYDLEGILKLYDCTGKNSFINKLGVIFQYFLSFTH